jgi:archaellum biogenesis protein FlaJ (TadC family)
MDIEPDIHLDNTGKLFTEFLEDKDKRFYRTYRLEDNDIDKSLNICKRKFAILGGLDLIVLTGLLIYSESLTREPDILIFFKAMTLLAGGYLYTEYNKTIAKINEMYKSMRDFERTRKVFTGQDKQKQRRSN